MNQSQSPRIRKTLHAGMSRTPPTLFLTLLEIHVRECGERYRASDGSQFRKSGLGPSWTRLLQNFAIFAGQNQVQKLGGSGLTVLGVSGQDNHRVPKYRDVCLFDGIGDKQ